MSSSQSGKNLIGRAMAVCPYADIGDDAMAGFLAPFAGQAERLIAVPVPDEANTLPAEDTAAFAERAGLAAETAPTALEALRLVTRERPDARVLFCGSLYLAGAILRENG